MTKHRIGRAEDVYKDVDDALRKPRALVVCVEGDTSTSPSVRTGVNGFATVRLSNDESRPPISVAIVHPWHPDEFERDIETLGVIDLGPEQAVALAKGLCTAAARSRTAPETEPPGVPCSTCNVTQAQIDCAIGRSRSEFDYHEPNCERRTFHEREPA